MGIPINIIPGIKWLMILMLAPSLRNFALVSKTIVYLFRTGPWIGCMLRMLVEDGGSCDKQPQEAAAECVNSMSSG